MTKQFGLCIICLAVLVSTCFLAFASAEIVVGVKEGDWIEYNVAITGEVPEKHDVTWCRFDVTAVDGKNVYVDITWRYINGSEETESKTLKLETGQIGDCFIIPANLNEGGAFLSPEGYIMIRGVEEKTCAGATRRVVSANTTETMFYWDKSTGVLVQANSTYSMFTMFTKVDKTNMWQPQIFGLDPTVFIVLVVVLAAVLAVALFLTQKMAR